MKRIKSILGMLALCLGIVFFLPFLTEDVHAANVTMGIDSRGQWRCYQGGRVLSNYTGMACNEYGWWYFENGNLNPTYTGMACNEYGWFYYRNGNVDFNYTGMAYNEYGWWYYYNGGLVWNYTGPACNEYGWWAFRDGHIDFSFNGMMLNDYGWWYFRNGAIDLNYTGMACNEYGWWYFQNGVLNPTYTGMACNENGWFYYRNGNVDFSYTGMAYNEYGWWYFRDGWLDTSWSGIAQNEYGYWYYTNGNINFGYTGTINYKGKIYNVVNGCATLGGNARSVDSRILNSSATNYAQKYDLSAFDTTMLPSTKVYSRMRTLNISLDTVVDAYTNKNNADAAVENALSGLPTERVYYTGSTVGDLAMGGLNDFLLANQGKIVTLTSDVYIQGGNNTGDTIMIPSNTILDGAGHSLVLTGTAPHLGIVFYYIENYTDFHVSENAGVINLNSDVPYITNTVNLFGADKILIDNCNFNNCQGTTIVAETNTMSWANNDDSLFVKISNNTITNALGDGIAINGNPSFIKVYGNNVSNIAGRAGILVKCYAGDNPLSVESEEVGPHDVICESNVIHDVNLGADNLGEGLYYIGTYKCYAVNNTIYNCKLEGCCLDSGCIGTWFYGNEIYNTGTIGGLPGLSIDNGIYNFVDSNYIHDNSCDGVKFVRTGDANLVVNNRLTDNSRNLAGSQVSSGVDIEPLAVEPGDYGLLDGYGSDGNIIMGNIISGHSCGVYVAEDSETGTSIENVVKDNTISATGRYYKGTMWLIDFSSGAFNRMYESENTLQ